MKHTLDRNRSCLVAHYDESPGQCAFCRTCQDWVRPHNFNAECLGPKQGPVGAHGYFMEIMEIGKK